MKIYLRADANDKVGFGHLTRILAFAQALYESYDLNVITNRLPANFIKEFEQYNAQFIFLDSQDDIESEIQLISRHLRTGDLIIIDGYQFDSAYYQQLKSLGLYIIKVSDYSENIDGIDVLINHGGSININNYPTSLCAVFYMGPNYALIRKAFSNQSEKMEKGRVLVCLGGTANDIVLDIIITGLSDLNTVKHIDVITTNKQVNSDNRIHFHRGISDKEMANLMSRSDFVICPASSLSYEAATVHTGLIVGTLADNQVGLYAYLLNNKLALGIGDFNKLESNQFIKAVAKYLNTDIRDSHKASQKRLFDRNSHQRLKKIIDKATKVTELTINKAKESDVDLLYEWVTDKVVRQNAINTKPIKFEDHKKWVKSVVHDNYRELYIISHNDLPMAQIRFDIEEELATLSYSIASSYRGNGYGEAVVRKGISHLVSKRPEVKRIKAVVQEQNLPSNKVFESCNFERKERKLIEGMPFNIYYKG